MKASDCVIGIFAAQGQQVVERDAEFIRGIVTEVLFDERRRVTIKAGGHGRVRREKISRARGGQRDFKGLLDFLHETPGAFQHRKRRVTFIQVTDIGLDAERGEQPPATNPQQHFLLEAQLRSTAV